MASLSWTDALGAATLTNGKPVPADRFANYQPTSRTINDADEALGDGVVHVFTFRARHGVGVELRQIPVASMPLMLRLAQHLSDGGVVAVDPEDALGSVWPVCQLAQGAEPPFPTLSDAGLLEYTMSFSLVDARGSSAAPMLCVYA